MTVKIRSQTNVLIWSYYSADEEDDQVELRAAVNLQAEIELEFDVEIESEDEDEGEGEGEAEAEKKVEVEYAQVKFPKQPRHTQPTGDNYLYATVRKMRWFKWSVSLYRLHHWRSTWGGDIKTPKDTFNYQANTQSSAD